MPPKVDRRVCVCVWDGDALCLVLPVPALVSPHPLHYFGAALPPIRCSYTVYLSSLLHNCVWVPLKEVPIENFKICCCSRMRFMCSCTIDERTWISHKWNGKSEKSRMCWLVRACHAHSHKHKTLAVCIPFTMKKRQKKFHLCCCRCFSQMCSMLSSHGIRKILTVG